MEVNNLSWDELIAQDARWERAKIAADRLVSRHDDWVNSRIEYRFTGDKTTFVLRVWSTHGHVFSADQTSSVYCDGIEVVIPLIKDVRSARWVPDLVSWGQKVAPGCALTYQVEGAGSILRWAEDETDGGAMYEAQVPTALLEGVYERFMPLYWEPECEYSYSSKLTPVPLPLIPHIEVEEEPLADWERELLEGEGESSNAVQE